MEFNSQIFLLVTQRFCWLGFLFKVKMQINREQAQIFLNCVTVPFQLFSQRVGGLQVNCFPQHHHNNSSALQLLVQPLHLPSHCSGTSWKVLLKMLEVNIQDCVWRMMVSMAVTLGFLINRLFLQSQLIQAFFGSIASAHDHLYLKLLKGE